MATTVGQHSVAAFTSPVNGTTPIDANSVRGNDNTVRSAYVDHDADPGIHVQSSTLASRPAAGTAGRKWITEDSGVYTLWFDDGTNWHPVSSENINLTVLATETLVKGDVVKVTGWNNGQDLPEVAKVSSTSDTAFAIITANVANGAMGYATNTGIVQDLATNGFSAGAILYPNTSGWFTATKPTSGTYQAAAYVLRSNANNGVLYVEFSAPRIVERSDNTASTIVLRDASGNFSAGTITAGAVTSTGLVTFASLKGTGATTVTNILDEDNMASDSATALATQQSIKAYVDTKVATVDTLAEVLANGNTTGANNIIVSAGQKITTNTIDETTSGSGVTIDSVLLKDDVVNATDIETGTVSANDGTLAVTIANSTGALTLSSALADSNLATISTAGKVANSATTATSANTNSAIVARDSSGNFSAGTITANLTGNISGTAPAGTLTGTTLASNVVSSSLTSVGTLTSLAVTGDLTVDTSTLKVDSSNNRVGVVNASPAYPLDVTGPINTATGSAAATYKINGTDVLSATTLGSGVTASSLTSVGTLTSLTVSGAITGATSTNTINGIVINSGAITGSKLTVSGVDDAINATYTANSTASLLNLRNATNGTAAVAGLFIGTDASSQTLGIRAYSSGYTTSSIAIADSVRLSVNRPGGLTIDANDSAGVIRFATGGISERMRLDASGNLGLGVTPSAWLSAYKVFQNQGGSFASSATSNVQVTQNAYLNASTQWIYTNSTYASQYSQTLGQHQWYTAASGTANTAITFTQAMTLDASGNLGVGVSPSVRLHVKSVGEVLRLETTGATGNNYLNFTDASGDKAYVGFTASGSENFVVQNRENGIILFATNDTERARITSGGYFKASPAGTYNDSTGAYHEIRNNNAGSNAVWLTHTHSSDPYGPYINFSAAAPNNATNYFIACVDTGGTRATIRSNGGLANYQSNNADLSDARTKTDITPAASMWDKVAALEIVTYKYVDQTHDDVNLGVIAQQVEAVEPVWVDADGFGETPEGEEPLKTVYTKDITFAAIKALQEAMARIEALEVEVATLKANA